MTDRLHIRNEMAQLDRKNRDFYDDLTDEERKKFSNYLMIRWASTVQGDRDLQEYYVRSTNHYLNRHFFSINRHPKLQWLSATAVSPGLGTFDHHYIRPKKREGDGNEVKKTLLSMFPNHKLSDIDTLAAITDKSQLREYVRAHGNNTAKG